MELTQHRIALDAAMASQKALIAGVDIDMMSHLSMPSCRLWSSRAAWGCLCGKAVRRVLRLKFTLGLSNTLLLTAMGAVAEHRPLARRAAEESLVLLQNNPAPQDALLPLNPATKRLALIGPLADDASDMVGAWSGANNFGDVRTLRATMAERAQQSGAVLTSPKGTEISGPSDSRGSPQRLPRHRIPMSPSSPWASRATSVAKPRRVLTWICRGTNSSCLRRWSQPASL